MAAGSRLGPLALLAATALIAGCGGDDNDDGTPITAAGAESECAQVEAPASKEIEFDRPARVLKRGEKAAAIVRTSCGEFTIGLDTQRSPKTANSFAFLAEEGFYDDTAFHRIAPAFVVQGGDPTGTGNGGPGYSVDEPPPGQASYLRGMVAMAKTEVEPPGRSGSQFFVVTAPADADLPPSYAILGEVTDGLDVVESIDALGDPATEQPLRPVVIETVTIEGG